MTRPVPRRALLLAATATPLLAALPATASAASPQTGPAPTATRALRVPARYGGTVIAEAVMSTGPTGTAVRHRALLGTDRTCYGYRILAPVGALRTVAEHQAAGLSESLALRAVLAQLRGRPIVLLNGVRRSFRDLLVAAAGYDAWHITYPDRPLVAAAAHDRHQPVYAEVVAFLTPRP